MNVTVTAESELSCFVPIDSDLIFVIRAPHCTMLQDFVHLFVGLLQC